MAPLIASSPDERVTSVAVQGLHHLFKMDTDGDMHCVQLSKEVGLDEHLQQLLERDRDVHGERIETACEMMLERMGADSELLTMLVKPATARILSSEAPR